MEKLLKIIEKYINKDDYFIYPIGDKSTLIFCMGYTPYKLLDKNHGQIDSYYYTSNKSYFVARSMMDEMNENGYKATMSKEFIKPLVKKANFGESLYNTLVAVNNYGTRVVFQAIDIAGNYQKLGNYQAKNLCSSCNKCKIACPNNALSDGFNYDRCLRAFQDKTDLGDDKAKKAQHNRIIGCDTCQRVCPYNKPDTKEVPEDLKEFLRLDNLLIKSREGTKSLDFLLPYIGKNFLRVKRVRRMTINSILNSGNEELISMLTKDEIDGNY